VAIKFMLREALASAEAVARFAREARAAVLFEVQMMRGHDNAHAAHAQHALDAVLPSEHFAFRYFLVHRSCPRSFDHNGARR
jgi:hypothetical protein